MDKLREKVVLITGASSGIGAVTAVLFAKHGSSLALHGRNRDNLENVAGQCVQAGLARKQIVLATGELADSSAVENLMKETIEFFHKLHILVNNAGCVSNFTIEDFDEVMSVNLRAVVQLTKLAVPYLKETKGIVVNNSSVRSQIPCAGRGAYRMSKAALDMFTRQLSLELASHGVRVNSVNPGFVPTNITRSFHRKELHAQVCQKIEEVTPLGRNGTSAEIGQAIVFLASDESSFMTGASIVVDGGMTNTSAYSMVQEKLKTMMVK